MPRHRPARRPLSLALIALCTATASVATALPAGAATATGPSTTTRPYLLPVAPGVSLTSLLTVNDAGAAGNGYEMVGIPDGLGAYETASGTVVLMNHELRESAGVTRAHGQKGAFVSKLTIDDDDKVVAGEDFIKTVSYYRYLDRAYGGSPQAPAGVPLPAAAVPAASATATTPARAAVAAVPAFHTAAFGRFCSGYLSEPGQLKVGKRGPGYAGQLYFANEEVGDEGRVFAVTPRGLAYQLPRLGLFSWENTIVAPTRTAATVVLGNEDSAVGELRVYAGRKQFTGSPVERAGLTNGRNHVVKVPGATTDTAFRAAYGKKAVPFGLVDNEWDQSGAKQNAEAVAEGALALNRIEDGAFDPDNRNDYYFVTTEGGDAKPAATGTRDGGGLWRLRFKDVERPQLGGSLQLVLDGSESWGEGEPLANKPDNMTIDDEGNLLIQEDAGGNDHLSRVLSYRIDDGARGVVARFDAKLFGATRPAGTTPDTRAELTTDEESSGIIQVADGSYLLDAQVHTSKGLRPGTGRGTVEEYVELGQLLRMTVKDFDDVYTVDGDEHEDEDDGDLLVKIVFSAKGIRH